MKKKTDNFDIPARESDDPFDKLMLDLFSYYDPENKCFDKEQMDKDWKDPKKSRQKTGLLNSFYDKYITKNQ